MRWLRISKNRDLFSLSQGTLKVLLVTALCLEACSNNINYKSGVGNNQVQAPPPNSTSNNGGGAAVTLTRVVGDTLNPTSVLDLIGDGSGSFGTLCLPTNSTSSSGDTSTAPVDCECSFSYSSSTNPNQQIFTPVTYHETNMLRCSYANIPAGIASIKVSIHLVSSDSYSNVVTYKLNSSGTSVDPTSASSFIQPIRYQCRDIINIPGIFDSTIYDPFQSEDFHLTYPLDFYASNLGNAISQYVASKQSNWNCPPILNPKDYLTPSALASFYSTNHINLNIYSSAPLPGGGVQIYPPNGSIDRSTFYVAKQAAGVFTVPVDAIMAPGLVTSQGSTTAPPLGYGAAPVPIGNAGSGQETCDTSVIIPSGFHWMKLWLFRAGLSQRHYAQPGGQTVNILTLGSLSCDPGEWKDVNSSSPATPIFPQCDVSTKNKPASSVISLPMVESATYPNAILASRVSGNNQCIQIDDGTVTGITRNACTLGHPGASCDTSDPFMEFLNQSVPADYWKALPPFSAISSQAGCGNVPDPFGICTPADSVHLPRSYSVGTGNVDNATSSSPDAAARFDFLYVVSPPSVNTIDMQNSNSAALPYHPYRFFTDQDCNATDPSLAPAGDCLLSNAITNYGLKLHNVNTNGDPPANDPNRPGIFPICVLQPD